MTSGWGIYFLLGNLIFWCYAGRPAQLPQRTSYNEQEAKLLLNLAAAAYSTNPQPCLNRSFPQAHLWRIFSTNNQVCDILENLCSFYTVVSDASRQVVIVFRGTKTKEQLLLEAWQSIQPGVDFFGVGKVNKYFFNALNILWPQVESALKDPYHQNYAVTFTGHSLGGALASLAALRTAYEKIRPSNMIKLYTFGQPRVGNVDLAMLHDQLVPFSFRVVHRLDIIPHSPPCDKDEYAPGVNANDDSKPCDPTNKERGYHHGIEIWYPNGMADNDTFYECTGTPKGEDFFCSDSLSFELSKYKTYASDHRHYFDHKVPAYGKLGCPPDQRGMEELMPNDTDMVPQPQTVGQLGSQQNQGQPPQPQQQQEKPSWWLRAKSKLAGFTRILGLTQK